MNSLLFSTFENVLRCTVTGTLAVLIVFLARRLGSGALSPRIRCLIWLPALLLFIAPPLPDIGLAIQTNNQKSELKTAPSIASSPHMQGNKVEQVLAAPPSTNDVAAEVPFETVPIGVMTPMAPFDWMNSMAWVWFIGLAILITVGCVGYIELWRRIRLRQVPPSEELLLLFADCVRTLRVSRIPRLQVTGAIQSPALVGLLRPTIVVPPAMFAQLTHDEMRMTLLHELGHVQRRDLWFHWATLVIQCVHWFNPIVWLAGRHFRADRETACDATVIRSAATNVRHLYGSTLIKLQTALAADSWRPLNGMLGSLDLLKQRIREIGRSGSTSGRAATLALLFVFGLSTLIAFSAARSGPALGSEKEPSNLIAVAEKPSPSGRVVTPNGQPAPGAEVWLFGAKRVIAKTKSDASGVFTFTEPLIFDRPDAIGSRTVYTVVATLEGYGFAWENIRADDAPSDGKTLQLAEECVYHGKLLDQKHKPLSNGKVWCVSASSKRDICHFDTQSLFLQAQPDADGTFTVRGLPPGGIGINAGSPDSWIAYHYFDNFDKLGKNPKQHRMFCGPGTTLRGRVLTQAGKSVKGAEVNIVTKWNFYAERSTITDEEGAFEFTQLYNTTGVFNPGEAPYVLSIRHADFTAEPQVVRLKPGTADALTIQAIPGTLVEGILIDRESLKPIADGELHISMDLRDSDYSYGAELRTGSDGHFSFRIALPVRLSLKTMPIGFCFVEPDDPITIKAGGEVEKVIFEVPPMRPLVNLTIATDPPLPDCEFEVDYKKNLRTGAKASEEGRGQLKIRGRDGDEYNGWSTRKAKTQGKVTLNDIPSDCELTVAATAVNSSRIAFATIKITGDQDQRFTLGSFSKAVTATFKLIDEYGNPWSDTDIQLDLKAEDDWLSGFRQLETDREGQCTIKGFPEKAQLSFVIQAPGDWRTIRHPMQLPEDLTQPIVLKIENTEKVWIKDESGQPLEIVSVDDVLDKSGKSYGAARILGTLPNNGFVISRKTMPTRTGYTITLAITTKEGRKLRATGRNTSLNRENLNLVVE